ncbi:hypothetical protein [Parvibaculum sp.]|uniref:hypothetical protein n=1 Tax=Parvibaculum sp. TaxID=2024848 RepID=UPI00320D5356
MTSEQDVAQNDFDTIESAVMESPRGRWFLAEFARRARAADTDRLLAAIERHTHALQDGKPAAYLETFRRDLQDMCRSIVEAQQGIAATKPREGFMPRSAEPGQDAETIAASAERATLDILAAVERLQDMADQLRRQGADGDLCDEIETHARGIFMSASFLDITSQRTTKLVGTLRYLEQRLNAMLAHEGSKAAQAAD